MTEDHARRRSRWSWPGVVGLVVVGVLLGQLLALLLPPDRDLPLGPNISMEHGWGTLVVWVLPLFVAGLVLFRSSRRVYWSSAVLVGWLASMVMTFCLIAYAWNSSGLD